MSGQVICAPLRVEARALRRGLRGAGSSGSSATAGQPGVTVVRTGYGPVRSAEAASMLEGAAPDMIAVGGVAASVTGGGHAIRCPSAPLLAGELRRAGLRVQVGPIATAERLFGRSEHARLAASGAIAVDMESAQLLSRANGTPTVAVRAISDTPEHGLVSPRTITGGLAALRALREAGPALAKWAAAVAPRRVLMASPRSFCAGVERAIEIVELALERYGAPVYVRKQIVHNTSVVASLEKLGAIFVNELDEVPEGAKVVFSAHGVSPAVKLEAERRGLDAVDATCPLVAKVHAEARRFAADGYLVALIGHAGHEEVEGTMGEAPDATSLVENAHDVARLEPADPGKVAYLMQTTLAADEAAGVVDAILDRFPSARGPGSDDICYATTNRQNAVRAIAADSDLVLVVGSANSSNSLRLVETAQRAGTPAYLVDKAEDIELGWLAGTSTVGITAGASAPPAVVGEIVEALAGLGQIEMEEVVVTTEAVQFGLPKELRQPASG